MTRSIEYDETPGRIIETPDPTWFTTQLTEGGHTYPFFDTEDGDIFGLGHQDPEAFAREAAAYWREVGLDDEDFGAGEIPSRVEHRWYLVEESDPEKTDYAFFIHATQPIGEWRESVPRTPVTADTPGAVAITTVSA